MTDTVERIVLFFETLSPPKLDQLSEIYLEEATFRDPFHDVRGISAIAHIYRRMFEALDSPCFVVERRVIDGPHCFLTWQFSFRFKRWQPWVPRSLTGVSHLQLSGDGRIAMHRDYWDAAGGLYEKLPLLGSLMRWLRRRAGS